MVARTMHAKKLTGLLIGLGLLLLPVFVLVFALFRAGCWKPALEGARGKYSSHGISGNPWLDFLSLFVVPMAIFVGLSWALSIILECSWPIPLRLAIGVPVVLLASVVYGWSMVMASLVYLWFQDALVIGTVGSPVLFWISALISLVSLGGSHYRLLSTGKPL